MKSDAGAIGLMDYISKLTRWVVAGPVKANLKSVESIKTQSKGPIVKHQEQLKSG